MAGMLSCPVSPLLLHIIRKLPSVQSMNKHLLTKDIPPIADYRHRQTKPPVKGFVNQRLLIRFKLPMRTLILGMTTDIVDRRCFCALKLPRCGKIDHFQRQRS